MVVGSIPTVGERLVACERKRKAIAAGLEPATVGSEVQRSSIEPRGHTAEAGKVDTEGFEPSTSRMRNGRSSTELSALLLTLRSCKASQRMRPYSGESTPSRPIWEVKHRQAQLVLR